MAPISESPNVTLRDKAAPSPTYAGLSLPSALLEMRNIDDSRKTPKPSEMTSLAVRLKSIRLDESPDSDGSPDTSASPIQPARLDFSSEVGMGKENMSSHLSENVGNGSGLLGKIVAEESGLKNESAVKPQATSIAGRAKPAMEGAVERTADELRGNCDETSANSISVAVPLPERTPEPTEICPTLANTSEISDESRQAAEKLSGPDATQLDKKKSELSNTDVNQPEQSVPRGASRDFSAHAAKILEGKEKWAWPERCESMSKMSTALQCGLSEHTVQHFKKSLNLLSTKVNDQLDELRPSVITSALGLVNSIVLAKVDVDTRFAEDVFPSVMDLACGVSLTAGEAAKTLAIQIEQQPKLRSILEEADNPVRLCEILEKHASNEATLEEERKRAKNALGIVRAIFPEAKVLQSDTVPQSVQKGPPEHLSPGASAVEAELERLEGLQNVKSSEAANPNTSLLSARSRLAKRASMVLSGNRSGHMSWNARLTPSSRKSDSRGETVSPTSTTSSQSPEKPLDVRNGTPVVRNKKLGDSLRKISPGSLRKRRMYTEAEVEEARRAAMRVVMEEASQSYAKERQKLTDEKQELQRQLKNERTEITELKSVLEEYELTMQKMVSHGNSQASAQQAALEAEKNRLKAELLEVSESFEQLKEKYELSKEAITVFENKENRFVDQIKELKRNMVELQNWSNALKANTEKKLAKAFESVTTYRASYMDKEAYAEKAISDLQRTQAELEKTQQSLAETAATVTNIETSLHNEQDARSKSDASLTTAKASLARVTAHKDRVQRELAQTEEELNMAKAKIAKLQDASSLASEAQKKIESYTAERQKLKARAYDDMTRIRDLEAELASKEKDLDEMSSICEEAMSQLEQTRPGAK